jgi:hypothetical protein
VSLYSQYLHGAVSYLRDLTASAPDEWNRTKKWYDAEGRQLFIDAFTHETKIRLPSLLPPNNLVGAGIPKSFTDLNSKVLNDAFYLAHATWFLQELDLISERLPATPSDPRLDYQYVSIRDYVRNLLGDSIILFEHWGHMRAQVPGVFGGIKSTVEHVFRMYHGARQIIYGSGTQGLSPSGNHAELATSILRQALELRMRRGFGINGKISRADQSFRAIGLNDLLDAVGKVEKNATIYLSVPLENIVRINSWANLYLHGGLKLYSWTAARVLLYLQEFCIGGEAPGFAFTVNAGIRASQAAFDAVQAAIKLQHELGAFDVLLVPADKSDVIIV